MKTTTKIRPAVKRHGGKAYLARPKLCVPARSGNVERSVGPNPRRRNPTADESLMVIQIIRVDRGKFAQDNYVSLRLFSGFRSFTTR